MLKILFPCLLVVLLNGLLTGGCSDTSPPLPQGIVALVNGESISLRLVQAMQDTRSVGMGAQRPSVKLLQAQYGRALSTLIAQTLVMQELEKLRLSVSATEIAEAENSLRGDYPGDEFEKMLTEEYIDVELWRELLRRSLSMKTFEDKVLRPSLTVPLVEVDAYYTAYSEEFRLPERVTLLQVDGPEKAAVERAQAAWPATPLVSSDELVVQRYTIRRDSIPKDWSKALQSLYPGQATTVKENGGEFRFIALEALHPAKTLSAVESYPIIEKLLLEEKMDDAFSAWLEQALSTATVRVSLHLLPELQESLPSER